MFVKGFNLMVFLLTKTSYYLLILIISAYWYSEMYIMVSLIG